MPGIRNGRDVLQYLWTAEVGRVEGINKPNIFLQLEDMWILKATIPEGRWYKSSQLCTKIHAFNKTPGRRFKYPQDENKEQEGNDRNDLKETADTQKRLWW